MKNVALHNLGCKVNSYEIEVMQQFLQEKGYNIVSFDEVADIYIVNTCTVTNIADRKSRQMLHRAKQKNPNAIVVAVGCYVQTGREAVEQDVCIDLAIGNNRKKDLIEILESYMIEHEREEELRQRGTGELPDKSLDKTLSDTTILDIDNIYEYEEMTLKQTAEHTRAYIKIQDGCNQFCTYCAIPLARGRVRSRHLEDIEREIRGMVEAGYREIVLTGIHISSYGIDFDEEQWQQGMSVEVHKKERLDYSGSSKLIDLVEKIAEIPGLERIRLGSLEPRVVTRENAARLAAIPTLCPHFHLSLQSGCDETLRRMNRRYTAAEYEESVENLRAVYDNPAITTDVIVGFPGETAEEFAETKVFLEKISFYEMHIFKYSKRAGTKAAGMPGQISGEDKTARSNELFAMEQRQSIEFRKAHLHKELEVLLEEEKEIAGRSYWLGHTADYVKVAVEGNFAANDLVILKAAVMLTDEILLGEC